MSRYSDAYRQGMYDKDKGLPMSVPDAINNTDVFIGYFDGYGGHQYNPPEDRKSTLEKNIKRINLIT